MLYTTYFYDIVMMNFRINNTFKSIFVFLVFICFLINVRNFANRTKHLDHYNFQEIFLNMRVNGNFPKTFKEEVDFSNDFWSNFYFNKNSSMKKSILHLRTAGRNENKSNETNNLFYSLQKCDLNTNHFEHEFFSKKLSRNKKSIDQFAEIGNEFFLKCKLTPSGVDFLGTVSRSKFTRNEKYEIIKGDECIYWNSPQLKKILPLNNLDFPDGSIQAAKKYCRNPDNSSMPWCFNSKLERKFCDIPYCLSLDCRISGPGVEYKGKIDRTMYDNVCKLWLSRDIPRKIIGPHFPDSHLSKAHNFCRNPTNDPNGPYCFVDDINQVLESNGSSVVKEYCDVPICDLLNIGVYNFQEAPSADDNESQEVSVSYLKENDKFYTHYTSFNAEEEEINFDLRLWFPENLHESEIRIAISCLPVPAKAKHLLDWSIGFEIILSLNKSGFTVLNEENNFVSMPKILLGTHWVNLTLQWNFGFVTLKNRAVGKDNSDALFKQEFSHEPQTIFRTQNPSKFYYSIVGSPVFFSLNSPENAPETCDEHITVRNDYGRYFPLVHEYKSKIIDFYLKSTGLCSLLFVMSPIQINMPSMKLILMDKNEDNYLLLKHPGENDEVIASFKSSNLLSYDTWRHFSISILKERFQLFVDTANGLHNLFDINNVYSNILQWFTIGSNTSSHWTFMCDPNETEHKRTGVNDECTVSSSAKEYKGHMWISKTGQACLPWVAKYGKTEELNFEKDGSIEKAVNYCRNTNEDEKGAYCYIFNIHQNMEVLKEYCDVPKCLTCRKGGTGTDYDGSMSVTISNRTCQHWTSSTPHQIPNFFLEDDLFPDKNILSAQNFCRDPNSDISGPWCYTTDPNFPYEPCNVPDCDRPNDCTIYLTGTPNTKMLVNPYLRQNGLPFWLKIWHPLHHAGLSLKLFENDKDSRFIEVLIGENRSSTVTFKYQMPNQDEIILDSKYFEYIINTGSWTGFKLILKYGLIKLFLEGVPNAILSWAYSEVDIMEPFQPYYIQYGLIDEGPLGFSFNCKDFFPEIYQRNKGEDVFYPINIWKNERIPLERNITFFFRATRRIAILFYTLPSIDYDLKIDFNLGRKNERIYIKEKVDGQFKLLATYEHSTTVLPKYSWTNISILFSDQGGQIFHNSLPIANWKTSILKNYYYFGFDVENSLFWIANNNHPDIDGPVIDGGWSEWSEWECSRLCGGGFGSRNRTCTNPKPSFFGKLCPGEDTMSGDCNTFECGDISPYTLKIINERLKKYSFTLLLKENDEGKVNCFPDIVERIKEEAPDAELYWYKNEIELQKKAILNVDSNAFHWSLEKAKSQDTGTYICSVRLENLIKAIQVTTVIVITDHPTKILRAGKTFKLDCLSLQISSIYGHLLQSVYLNGVLWKQQILSQRSDTNYYEIHEMTREMSGIWECRLFQRELNASWTTNWINLKVLPKGSFLRTMFEKEIPDQMTGKSYVPDIGLIIFTGIMLILTFLGMYFLIGAWFSKSPLDYIGIPHSIEDEEDSYQHSEYE